MESQTWQIILAVAVASVLQAIAYAIREYANDKKMARLQTSMDGNTALCATSLVSNGTLPKAAPCIPAVAKAVSSTVKGCEDSADYATTAIAVAHETMTRENIPIQSQELLVDKLHAKIAENQTKIEDTATKEARHSENNAAWVKLLREEMERMKVEMAAMKSEPKTISETGK